MDVKDCIKFATENPICYLATAVGDQPRVRAFLLWYADPSGFYFVPLAQKEVTKQLQQNPTRVFGKTPSSTFPYIHGRSPFLDPGRQSEGVGNNEDQILKRPGSVIVARVHPPAGCDKE